MKVKTYVKMSLMPWSAAKLIRDEQAGLARFGEVPAPGSATLTLPAGTIKPATASRRSPLEPRAISISDGRNRCG